MSLESILNSILQLEGLPIIVLNTLTTVCSKYCIFLTILVKANAMYFKCWQLKIPFLDRIEKSPYCLSKKIRVATQYRQIANILKSFDCTVPPLLDFDNVCL